MKTNLFAYLSIIVLVASGWIIAISAYECKPILFRRAGPWDPLPPRPSDWHHEKAAAIFAAAVARVERDMQRHLVLVHNLTPYTIHQQNPLALGSSAFPNQSRAYFTQQPSEDCKVFSFMIDGSDASPEIFFKEPKELTVRFHNDVKLSVIIFAEKKVSDTGERIVWAADCSFSHKEFIGFSDETFDENIKLLMKVKDFLLRLIHAEKININTSKATIQKKIFKYLKPL